MHPCAALRSVFLDVVRAIGAARAPLAPMPRFVSALVDCMKSKEYFVRCTSSHSRVHVCVYPAFSLSGARARLTDRIFVRDWCVGLTALRSFARLFVSVNRARESWVAVGAEALQRLSHPPVSLSADELVDALTTESYVRLSQLNCA